MSNLGALLTSNQSDLDNAIVIGTAERLNGRDLLSLGCKLPKRFQGSNVALKISDPLTFIKALFALDGQVHSVTILSPDLSAEATAVVMNKADADVLIASLDELQGDEQFEPVRSSDTKWRLTTSGTTGEPKSVVHTFGNLVRSVKPPRAGTHSPIWGLLYDPSRLAGLQVVLQAIGGGGSLILSEAHDDIARRVELLVRQGCTHLSATPSMWRKILMTPLSDELNLQQVTLGGEIADDRILSALCKRYPSARVTHIYASTELGVGFAVQDGKAGFPASYLTSMLNGLAMKIMEGILWIKPSNHVNRPSAAHIRVDDEGYICTEDRVQIEDDRILFLGREATLVNVGGVKLQLEVLESKLRNHPMVSDCAFSSIANPILGSVLKLEVVPAHPVEDEKTYKREIKSWCRENLQIEAVPAKIELIKEMALAVSGKMQRVSKCVR
jgi:Acyl-CoA synthetases (AMP-forming)/AMP-acid ligases II